MTIACPNNCVYRFNTSSKYTHQVDPGNIIMFTTFKKTVSSAVKTTLVTGALALVLFNMVGLVQSAQAEEADIWYVTCHFDANGNLTGYDCNKGGEWSCDCDGA